MRANIVRWMVAAKRADYGRGVELRGVCFDRFTGLCKDQRDHGNHDEHQQRKI